MKCKHMTLNKIFVSDIFMQVYTELHAKFTTLTFNKYIKQQSNCPKGLIIQDGVHLSLRWDPGLGFYVKSDALTL
jgi:hypothetical protein